jgi:hypothetical protein
MIICDLCGEAKDCLQKELPARNTISALNAGTHSHKSCEGEAE